MIKFCRLTLSDTNTPTFKDTYSSHVLHCAYKPRTSMRLAFMNHSHSPELFALQCFAAETRAS